MSVKAKMPKRTEWVGFPGKIAGYCSREIAWG